MLARVHPDVNMRLVCLTFPFPMWILCLSETARKPRGLTISPCARWRGLPPVPPRKKRSWPNALVQSQAPMLLPRTTRTLWSRE